MMDMQLSYPDLQEEFVKYYFKKDQANFIILLMNNLIEDKFSRKQRFYPLGKKYSFFNQKTTIKNKEAVYQVVTDLFKLNASDSEFVLKSYYLLREIVSFAKSEGNEEIIKLIDSNPLVKSDPGLSSHYSRSIRETHENQDLLMLNYNNRKHADEIYCRQYRDNVYKCFNELNKD